MVLKREVVHVSRRQSIRIRIKTLMDSRVKLCERNAVALAKKTSGVTQRFQEVEYGSNVAIRTMARLAFDKDRRMMRLQRESPAFKNRQLVSFHVDLEK